MKSKANIGGHPIHPILVAFPIAFFSGAFIFDLLRIFGLDELGRTVEYLIIAGIIGALLAAVPGIIDFFFTVPPKSSGKKRAAKHGIINVTVLLLFAATLFYRRNTDFPSDAVIILMESVAIILLVWAGWMGGTLVYRNQIGVNPRYANAGKWKEVRAEISEGRISVRRNDKLEENQMMLVHAGPRRIVIARTNGSVVAFSDHCSHRGASLAGGSMICGTVQCPWHGSQFDTRTGEIKAGPGKEGIEVYEIKEEGDCWIIR